MSKKHITIVALATLFVILASTAYSYYRLFIQKDLMISTEVSCDPETEGPCYVWVCEPDWWTECAGDPDEDIWIYKIVDKMAYDTEECDPVIAQEGFFAYPTEYEYCPEPACEETDTGYCETFYCDPETEGEDCYDEAVWDDYVATLRENIEFACNDTYGDYPGVDYCTVLEDMDALLAEDLSGEEGGAEEDVLIEEDAESVEDDATVDEEETIE